MKAILFALLAGLSWGIGEVCTRSVLHTGKVGPVTLITLRSIIALPVIAAVCYVWVHMMEREPRDWSSAGAATLAKIALGTGVVAGAAGMIFFYLGIGTGEVSRVKPIAFSVAIASGALLSWALLGEPLSPRKIAAIMLIIAGILMLTVK